MHEIMMEFLVFRWLHKMVIGVLLSVWLIMGAVTNT